MAAGIRKVHQRSCASRINGECACTPAFEASVWVALDKKRLRRTFPTAAAARAWRNDSLSAVQGGRLRAAQPTTIRDAAAALLSGMRSGAVRTRAGEPYKPSAIRSYEAALRRRILPALGALRLSDVDRRDVQSVADRILGEGADPSTVRNALMPLRVIYRRALEDGAVGLNPTTHLRLPAVRGRRDRIATPDEALELIAALRADDQALWGMAFFAGLRRGEIMALRLADVDLIAGLVRVRRAWDQREGLIETKSYHGRRDIPIVRELRQLVELHPTLHDDDAGLMFGVTATKAFDPGALNRRALRRWKVAALAPITLHECRHTFVSILIASGLDIKAISTYAGHASTHFTLDRYGHLMRGSEAEVVAKIDAYIDRANSQRRLAQLHD